LRRLIVSFVVLLLLPAGAVVWLGIRLIQQDRAQELRQVRERRDSAADRIVASLEQSLSSTERRLGGGAFSPDEDAVWVELGLNNAEALPQGRLLYYPSVGRQDEELAAEFAEGEEFEFRLQDSRQAVAAFQVLTNSRDRTVRAGALLRLARNLRHLGMPCKRCESMTIWPARLRCHWPVYPRIWSRGVRGAPCSRRWDVKPNCANKRAHCGTTCLRDAGSWIAARL
jgi:hypothetical protein